MVKTAYEIFNAHRCRKLFNGAATRRFSFVSDYNHMKHDPLALGDPTTFYYINDLTVEGFNSPMNNIDALFVAKTEA